MSAIEIAWLSSPIDMVAATSDRIAVTSGSAIASSEPNATSRTTAAATTPTTSDAEVETPFTCWIAWPPSSTSRSPVRVPWARSMTRCTSALGICRPIPEKVIVAYAVRPSRLIWVPPAPAYGLLTLVTDGTRATSASIAATGC